MNNKKQAIILDIDNTIVKDIINVDLPQNNTREEWDEFHKSKLYYIPELYKIIKPIQDLIQRYLYSFEDVPHIIFMTARENTADGVIKYNTIRTIEEFLNGLNVSYDLYMRDENDYRDSFLVKEDLFKKFILNKYDILFVFDDDESNIKMFNRNNVSTLKVGVNDGQK